MQVMTACTASFAHGANDVADAVGPFAAIHYVWSNGFVTPSNTPTPVWILAYGGIMIVIGLATYGYVSAPTPGSSQRQADGATEHHGGYRQQTDDALALSRVLNGIGRSNHCSACFAM